MKCEGVHAGCRRVPETTYGLEVEGKDASILELKTDPSARRWANIERELGSTSEWPFLAMGVVL